jgi:hypothetical protein
MWRLKADIQQRVMARIQKKPRSLHRNETPRYLDGYAPLEVTVAPRRQRRIRLAVCRHNGFG